MIRRRIEWILGVCLLVLLLYIFLTPIDEAENVRPRPATASMQTHDNENVKAEEPPGPIKVALVTYTRGGSSLLGEAFNQNNDSALYWFEPLYGLYVDLYGAHVTTHGVQGDRQLPAYEEEAVIQTVLDMFHCKLDALSPGVLYNNLQSLLRSSMPINTRPFVNCLWTPPVNGTRSINPSSCAFQHLGKACSPKLSTNTCFQRLHNINGGFFDKTSPLTPPERHYLMCTASAQKQIAKCLPQLSKTCASSKLHAAKLVRLRMPTASRLKERDAGIKIVHLLRDPRGILNSRHANIKDVKHRQMNKQDIGKNNGFNTTNNRSFVLSNNKNTSQNLHSNDSRLNLETNPRHVAMVSDAKVLCPTIIRDLHASRSVQQRYGARSVFTLKYEEMTVDPLATLDRLYTFLKMDTPPSVRKWFNSTMHQGESRSGGTNTRKKDPSGIASRWKSLIKKDTMDEINKHCEEAIHMAGYDL